MDRQRLILLLVISVAVLARLMVLLERAEDLSTDPDGYVAHAQMLLAGQGFAGPYTGRPTAFRPPGYPLLIAAVPLSRTEPQKSIAMLHLAAGVLTVLLTRHLAEQTGLPSGLANLAALLAALDPMLLRYSALPMTEVISAGLLTAGVSAFLAFQKYRLAESEKGTGSNGVRFWRPLICGASSGILLGLGSLVRPICLIVAALLVLAAAQRELREFWRHRISGAGSDAAGLKRGWFVVARMMIPALFFALTISPWIIRNRIQFQRFIPATTHGGYTLALGNNPDYYRDVIYGDPELPWDGQALNAWQQKMVEAAAQAGIPAGDEPATDSWMYQQALQTIREQPTAFLRACFLRLRSFFSVRAAVEAQISLPRQWVSAVWYSTQWLFVIIAGLSGISGCGRFRTSELWLTIAVFLCIHSVYWTDPRMRAPLMPIFAVLTCVGIMLAWYLLRNIVGRIQSWSAKKTESL